VPYQSGAGTTAFIAAGSSGQLLQSNGTGAPTWVLPSSIISGNFVVVSGTTQTAATGTYYAMVNASTSTLTLPASPATGSIVGVTFTNGRTTNVIARNGQLIMGSALDLIVDDPDRSIELRYIDATNGWRLNNAAIVNVVSTSTIASVITTVQQNSNAAYYPTFVDSNNSTLQSESLFTTSSFVINPSTGNVGIGTTSPASKLDAYTSGATSTIIRARNDTTSVYLDANNGYAYLNVFTNHPLLIGTNNTERIRVTSTGAISFGSSGTATGTSGQVLTSNGSSSSPSWTTLLSTPDFLLLNSGII